MPLSGFRRYVFRSISALASAVPFVRPGTALPGAAGPLLAAPPLGKGSGLRQDRSRLRYSLIYAIREGMAAEVFTSCAGATVLTAWALALQLGPFWVGTLSALPFLAQGVQFPAAWLTCVLGHRPVALWTVTLSRLAMLPLCFIPWLPLTLPGQQRLLLVVAVLSALFGVLGNNAWVAWMGELVPESFRGRYFGRRTALCTVGGTVASLLAAALIDQTRTRVGLSPALPLLAGVACVAGILSTWLMTHQHDPMPQPSCSALTWEAVKLPLKDSAAKRVLSYQILWNAAVGVSAPYYVLHMLQNLKMSFVLVALHGAAVASVRILTAPLWGKVIDRVGAQPVLLLSSLGISFIPFIWLAPTPGNLWPLIFDVLLAGTLWSGHALAAFALPLSVAPRQGRPSYLAAFATAGGLAYAAASAVGGVVASETPREFTLGTQVWMNLHILFVLSSLTRLLATFFATRIVEPDLQPVSSFGGLVQMVSRRSRVLSGEKRLSEGKA